MGMFDELRCRYKLPIDGFDGHLFQTKSLDCELDLYEIREDGTLWREAYDVEDRSDPNAVGIMALAGCMTRVNKRFEQRTSYTGKIRFYDYLDSIGEGNGGWTEQVIAGGERERRRMTGNNTSKRRDIQ
jgi:hypothetical protein